MTTTARLVIDFCDNCEEQHEANESHMSETQGMIYAVVCSKDGLTDYYTSERVSPANKKG